MSEKKSKDEQLGLPEPIEHRISAKWVTLESLRILQDRLRSRGESVRVLLLTAIGPIQGNLCRVTDSYEDSLDTTELEHIDIASATIHLRTTLWKMYAERESELKATDASAVIHLNDVVIRFGSRRARFDHFALFATDIIGYTITQQDVI